MILSIMVAGIILFAGALTVFAGQAGPKSAPPQAPVLLSAVEDRVWRLTNDYRRRHGLSSLNRESVLASVSQNYSKDMLTRRFFSHTNPEGLDAGQRLRSLYSGPISAWGENIWEGSNISTADPDDLAKLIMDTWISSPEHRENILTPDYTHVGIGIAARGREIKATQLFAILRP